MTRRFRERTKREPIPCTEERGFAHRWVIDGPGEGATFQVGRCRYCEKEDVFRVAWPEHLNARLREIQRRFAEEELLDVL